MGHKLVFQQHSTPMRDACNRSAAAVQNSTSFQLSFDCQQL